jgi:hypothetical protein
LRAFKERGMANYLLYGCVGKRFTGLRPYFAMHQSARKPSFMPIFLPSA